MTSRSRSLVELSLEHEKEAENDGSTTHIENMPILFMDEVNVPDKPYIIHINEESSAKQEHTTEILEPNLVQTYQDPLVKYKCTTEFSEPYLILRNKEEQHTVHSLQNMQESSTPAVLDVNNINIETNPFDIATIKSTGSALIVSEIPMVA
ncbi:hypothetical protein FQA39_LY16559 [Lamprigera yunnana]|nr:hypothetical protein FQA39_LY16559 [Lamprigera yunnana]